MTMPKHPSRWQSHAPRSPRFSSPDAKAGEPRRRPLRALVAALLCLIAVVGWGWTTRAAADTEFFVGDAPHQMYVQYLAPADGAPARPYPLVLIHGGAHTGVGWTSTPDGGPGWAPYFAERGWPVYVVDWPGVGRSGFAPDFLTMGPDPIVDAVVALLDEIGPAALVGHSMGAGIAYHVAAEVPKSVPAVVALAPAAPAANEPAIDEPFGLDDPLTFSPEMARSGFAHSDRFPDAAFAQYYRSLVPLSPSVANAVLQANGDDAFALDPDALRATPLLVVLAEQDAVVGLEGGTAAANWLGVEPTLVGADWGLPSHGHMMMLEEGNRRIAERIAAWLEATSALATPGTPTA